ncbi:MmyB family transcriptional regulator [Streptomyces thermodiastaticus]|jgi:hypothetical protein|uniref:MmyB family transcriptional regulator n=1 Tax=Streptomyces thermodiastaticus TaxID=44061 RepID=UPI0016754EB3|nr:hypothetical protein [Streptomyces thermodiastaticus]MCE7552354.1 hypothetical protein [Streptomyces thermodiastaticus]GHF83887.1 hypothetical protein GCM10018787_35890 [Streptomyces thermodiastaticus]
MAFQSGGQRPAPRSVPVRSEAQAYLQDYAALLEAVSFPSFVVDHSWDVVLSNSAFTALFRHLGPHPTAMPDDNFLRFVLFHPEASTVLGPDHETRWCLPMLAQFAAALDRCGPDHALQALRRDIAQDPIMDAAYRQGVPHWLRVAGAQAAVSDGAVRPLIHPDPRRGVTHCRVVEETPQTLRDLGYTRITLVLRAARRTDAPARRPRRTRRTAGHLRVVPAPEV